MAVVAERLHRDEDDLLARYLRARSTDSPRSETDGIRTCTHCGERARFRIDPDGSWGMCARCGAYA